MAKLVAQKTLDGNRTDVIYYGLLPIHIPFRDSASSLGCERAGVSLGRVSGDFAPSYATWGSTVMAHQVGHECGLLHAPGVSHFPDPDPDYPAYPPYDPIGDPKGSRGEYGVEIGTVTWITLPRAKDIMGSADFGGDRGLSLYHYGRLLENPKLDPVYIGGITAVEARLSETYHDPKPSPMLSIIGMMRSERHLEITSVMRVATRETSSSTATTGLRAELRDESGAPIAQAPLRVLGAAKRGWPAAANIVFRASSRRCSRMKNAGPAWQCAMTNATSGPGPRRRPRRASYVSTCRPTSTD